MHLKKFLNPDRGWDTRTRHSLREVASGDAHPAPIPFPTGAVRGGKRPRCWDTCDAVVHWCFPFLTAWRCNPSLYWVSSSVVHQQHERAMCHMGQMTEIEYGRWLRRRIYSSQRSHVPRHAKICLFQRIIGLAVGCKCKLQVIKLWNAEMLLLRPSGIFMSSRVFWSHLISLDSLVGLQSRRAGKLILPWHPRTMHCLRRA